MKDEDTELGTAADLLDPTDLSVHGEPSSVNTPIFIVGCPRSGTTILRTSLDSHPRISAGPEEAALYWLARTDSDKDRERRNGYGVNDEAWFEMVRRLVEDLMHPYAENQGKTRWALKHPELALAIPFLNKVYPNCQVIHIVRNPRDVIASCQKMFGRSMSHRFGKLWTRQVRTAERDGPKLGPDRFKTIKYEDVVTDPAKQLRDVVEWLGEPWSEEVLWPHSRTHSYPATRKTDKPALQHRVALHTRSIGRSDREANLASLLYVRLKAADLTEKFGYKINLTTHI